MKNKKIKQSLLIYSLFLIIIVFVTNSYGLPEDTDRINKTASNLLKKYSEPSIIIESAPDPNSINPDTSTTTGQKVDIMLVLDNSGSMKKNDSKFITRDVVTELLNSSGEGFRLGMVIFDQDARLVEQLADMNSKEDAARFLGSLRKINYKGLFTNSPAGVERAIYELKTYGRKEARKVLILLTDGIIDTGSKERDIEGEAWLKNNLARECKELGIKIFGIAFTDKADVRMLQILASRTDGEYFRAYNAEEIPDIFKKINKIISTPQIKEKEAQLGRQTLSSVLKKQKAVEPDNSSLIQKQVTPEKEKIALKPELIVKQHSAIDTEKKKKITKTRDADKSFKQPLSGIPINYYIIIMFCIILVVLVVIYRRQKKEIIPDDLKTKQVTGIPEYHPVFQAELIDVDHIITKESVSLILNKQTVTIGRDSSNDIVIPREFISSLHATIEYKNGYYYLEDHRSTNGTSLNKRKIQENKPARLKSGDTIHFANYEFRLLLHDQAPYGETVMLQKDDI